jgi:catechol 2,3-dioxygenase-like lactoylglutathione lyase family enzyme
MITALHHVNVTVPAELEDAAKDFYGSVLGLKQIPKPQRRDRAARGIEIGDVQLHLSVEDEDHC